MASQSPRNGAPLPPPAVCERLAELRAKVAEEHSRISGLLTQMEDAASSLAAWGARVESGHRLEARLEQEPSPVAPELPCQVPTIVETPVLKVVQAKPPEEPSPLFPESTRACHAATNASGVSESRCLAVPRADTGAALRTPPKVCTFAAPSHSLQSFGDPKPEKAAKWWNRAATGLGQRVTLGQAGHRVFADADLMKVTVRQAILQSEYRVTDLYYETGMAQLIARSYAFEALTTVIILANSIWLGVETDYNNSTILIHADPGFQVVEHLFCVLFSIEWLVRFCALRRKLDGLNDAWFVFDSALLLTMVLETWVLSIIVALTEGAGTDAGPTSILRITRLFRLTRAARVARLLRAIPELMIIVKGVIVVTRTVSLIICLLVLIVYVFAIMFTQIAKDTDLQRTHFENVGVSMMSLTLGGIIPDMGPMTRELGREHVLFSLLFFIFVVLSFVTIMNMLIGVLVEVVGVVASVEKESNEVSAISRVLSDAMKWTDANCDQRFGHDEVVAMLNDPRSAKGLADVGVDVLGLVDYSDYIFRHAESLSFEELLDIVLQLRGKNATKVNDLVQMRKYLHEEMQRLAEVVNRASLRSAGS